MAYGKSLELRNLQRTVAAPQPVKIGKGWGEVQLPRKNAPKKRHTGMARGKAKAMVGKAARPKNSRRA